MTNTTISSKNPYKICFVCLGNICRSPTGEGVLQHLINKNGLQDYFHIDSAGTSAYHLGEPANTNSQRVANKHGIELTSLARRFEKTDLDSFDLILAMDEENYQNLIESAEDNHVRKIKKLRDFDPLPGDGNVPDPYHGGMDGFDKVYRIIYRSSEALLESLEQHIQKD
ncbi:MAG: low molecular weight protein-tyrosine-phosphatase [Balneolaceae bacterium]